MDKKLRFKRIVAIVLTIMGTGLGIALSNMYLIALTLGISTLYLTIIEFAEDWSIALVDLVLTGLFMLGGAQVGVFGVVVGLGIAFGSSMFLPGIIRDRMPALSVVCWRNHQVFKRREP